MFIEYATGYVPGAIGRVAEMHGAYYHANWGFGLDFEAAVASELAGFMLRFDASRDGFWSASKHGRIEGTVSIDARDADAGLADAPGAHLRWFIVSDTLRGQGVGRRLIEGAVRWCRDRGYRRISLWTFEGLHAARHLYEHAGFSLVEEHRGDRWGTFVNEQHFELLLSRAGHPT
ncbi:MAG: GNAT family N-acetyltransferase [Gammaproteobacteria bacterium]